MQEVCDATDDDMFDRYSVDSLDCAVGKPSVKALPPAESFSVSSGRPFRLHGENHKRLNLLELPSGSDVKEDSEAMKRMWNCEIDESILISKGLQLNGDGSFSKSPREEGEGLPFVMPAAKVAQIRQRKQNSGIKNLRDAFDLKSKEERSLQNIAVKKLPTILTSRSSNFIQRDDAANAWTNLTDSMTEVLHRTYKERRKELAKAEGTLPKLKKENCVEVAGKLKSEESVRTARNPKKNTFGLQLPSLSKTKLSYYERYQKKNGFDPQSITLKGLKPVSDTVRSNFGDSATETLSDVSSGIVAVEVDDDEELFYQKMMNGEKVPLDEPVERSERSSAKASKSVDRSKEIKMGKTTTNKPVDARGKKSPSTGRSGKSQHLCGKDSEPVAKADLMSKARAYGNLANTRNIVKLQMKSHGKAKIDGSVVRYAEPDKKEPFLPPLLGKPGDAHLPWETRSLLMQISTGRDLFNQNMSNLKNQINALRMMYLPEKEV